MPIAKLIYMKYLALQAKRAPAKQTSKSKKAQGAADELEISELLSSLTSKSKHKTKTK
jgi:hypothetical protein